MLVPPAPCLPTVNTRRIQNIIAIILEFFFLKNNLHSISSIIIWLAISDKIQIARKFFFPEQKKDLQRKTVEQKVLKCVQIQKFFLSQTKFTHRQRSDRESKICFT